MRVLLAALLLCLAGSAVAAKPSRIAPDEFRGEPWLISQAGTTASDVNHIMRCPPPHCARRVTRTKWKKRHRKPAHIHQYMARRIPVPVARPVVDDDQAAAYRAIAALLAGGRVYVRPAALPAPSLPAVRKSLLGGLAREIGAAFGMPHRFVRGHLICARNVNVALAERGIRGTGSALAKSFLRWGRQSRPVPGAIAVFNRGRKGGHVAIVHSVKPNGTVIYLNPSASKQRWVIGPYRKRPISYRVAA